MTTETNSSEKRPRLRREWVKNAVIVFLAVMLVLTFFSNTIMNWSLPEVAAQYPQSTTLVTKIRGSGTVEAAMTYDVSIEETRTVASVAVKAGDKVAAGDLLLTLDEQESQELADARAALAALQQEYDKMSLSHGDQTHAEAASLQQLRDAVAKAEADLARAQSYESAVAWYQAQVTAAQSGVRSAQQYLADVNAAISRVQNQKDNLTVTNQEYLDLNQKVTQAQAEVNRLTAREPAYSGTPGTAPAEGETAPALESPAHQAWQTEMNAAKQTLSQATWDRDQLLAGLTLELDQQLAALNDSRITAESNVTYAQAAVDSANSALSQYQTEHPEGGSVSASEAALKSARDALTAAEAAGADKAAESAYNAASQDIDLAAKAQELETAREKVAALEKKSGAANVVSRYPGVVRTVNVAAGDKTSPETPMMVVELTERGYTMKSSVTREQARTLREGMTAEITNLWNQDVTLTLASIKTDSANPASGIQLTFLVGGEDAAVGQQLSYSIGDKNMSFDVVVPSAAVHTDADGSFVYTVSVRSSPLGNRYTVQKTKVNVIASDDTRSALSGDVTTADFVITTATVPLSVGQQVRIAE